MRRLMCVIAMVALLPAAAWAQAPPRRPYRGLFGGGSGDTPQSAYLSGSLGGGYDSNTRRVTFDPSDPAADPSSRRNSTFARASVALGYSLTKSTFGISAHANAGRTMYRDVDDASFTSYGAGAGFSWQPATKISVSASESLSYSPFYSLGPSAELGDVGPPNLFDAVQSGLGLEPQLYAATQGTVSYRLTRSLAARGSYSQVDTLFRSGEFDFSSRQARGDLSYSRQIRRYLGFRIGYSYAATFYQTADDVGQWQGTHGGDFGLDFGRGTTINLTRRLVLTFNAGLGTGRSLRPDSALGYFASGDVGLRRSMFRTWHASLDYRRGLRFVALFQDISLVDGVSAGYGGLLSRRMSFQSVASASTGQVGLRRGAANRVITYEAQATLGVALSRYLSVNTNYRYSRYTIGQGLDRPAGLDPVTDRHTVTASLGVWAPLFTRTRRPNASR